ncbi:MAG: metalloregulator ArsR/SmtB family transcription factor [Ignavibacteria bacterium]|nr:metalloregulator ArsR/SmtB family transcription factor [Ignavibacteria bacterium]
MLNKQEKIFKALSDKNRIRILKILQIKPLCVCEIKELLKLAVSTVSKHLSILKDCGLIIDDKVGKWVNYKLNINSNDTQVLSALLFVQLLLENDEIILEDRKKVKEIDRSVICSK